MLIMIVLYNEENFKIIKIEKDDFYSNKTYFIEGFDDISNSNNMIETTDLDFIFSESLSNSVICAIIDNRIVSYIVARNLEDFWHIDFIKTHYNYQKKGIGKKTLLMCFKDIIEQGGVKISYLPSQNSRDLFNKIILENENLIQIDSEFGKKIILKK